MLILINTSVDTTFVFSIDNHILEVIEADFVPIVPYNTTNILVGIGKRFAFQTGIQTLMRSRPTISYRRSRGSNTGAFRW